MKNRIATFLLALCLPVVAHAYTQDLFTDEIKTGQEVGVLNDNFKRLYASKLDIKPGDIIPKRDSTYTLGSSTYRWLNAYFDAMDVTDITATTVTAGTVTASTALILGGAAPSVPTANAVYRDSIVKSWVNYNQTGTIAIRDSFNVTSLTDNAVGYTTITFETDFANANYAFSGSCEQVGGSLCAVSSDATGGRARTTGALSINVKNHAATDIDSPIVNVIVIGDQ